MNIDQIRKTAFLNRELLLGKASGGAIVFEGEQLKGNHELREAIKINLKNSTAAKISGDVFGESDMGTIWVDQIQLLWRIRYFNNHMDGYSSEPWNPLRVRRILNVIAV